MSSKRVTRMSLAFVALLSAGCLLWGYLFRSPISRADLTATVLYVVLDRGSVLQETSEIPLGEVNTQSLPTIGGKIDRLVDGWGRPVRLWRTPRGMTARSAGPDGIWQTLDDMVAEWP